MRQTYVVVWSPEGREIARVQARSLRHACRLAPKPYRQFQGELYAQPATEFDAAINEALHEVVEQATEGDQACATIQ